MIEKIFQKLLENAYPNRDFETVKIGKTLFTVSHDCIGSLTYSLQGTHSYEEVKNLNALTTYSARYGYCPEKGPIAIIGIPNANADWRYFKEVSAYGEITTYEDLEFKKYSIEDAKHIGNYTVYGIKGIEKVANLVKFDKINSVYDSRCEEVRFSHELRVLKMKCKLEGQYSFKEAETLTKNQQRWAVDRGMAYATLENGQHVAIMSFWYEKKNEATGFRDVWESKKTEPPIQKITFMTDEEAAAIKDFSIYLYDYNFFYKPEKAPHIVKIDRTFAPGFDFYDTPDGKDLRLSDQI
ncbi:MAG: hypothetical protein Q4G04_06955 [bacterium]|nr:hypothetical protein [bacterium]